MAEKQTVNEQLQNALDDSDWDRVEELWLECLELTPIPTEELLEARRQLFSAGKKNLALTLLELLAEALEDRNDSAGALEALRELVRLRKTISPEETKRLQKALTANREGLPTLAGALEKYDLANSRRPLEELEAIELILNHDVGTVVEVIGQGVGRVTGVNLELENIKIDIGSRRPVSMPFGAVSRFLRRLPDDDFLRDRVERPEELAAEVVAQPGETLVRILLSLGEESDVAAIKNAMGDLLPASKWSSWWTKARKHPRILSSGTGSRLKYSVSTSAASATERLLDELREAEDRQRLAIAKQLATRGDEAAAPSIEILEEMVDDVEDDDPGLAWETASLIGSFSGGEDLAEEIRARIVESCSPQLLLATIDDRSNRLDALNTLREAHDEDWTEIWSTWFPHEDNASTLSLMARELEEHGAHEALDQALETIFRNHLSHTAQFMWGLERISDDDAPKTLASRMTPSLLEKIPDTLSRPEFSSYRSRAKGLLDGGEVAVRVILESASPQQAQRFEQRVSRIDGVEPQRTRVIEQASRQIQNREHKVETPLFVASAKAIEAKRSELKELLEIEIPKTLKGINAAAAEGDLRENFEYHMLRDRQELQSARAAKLQQDLGIVRELAPGSADTSKVNLGTVVSFEALGDEPIEDLTILGDWDADLSKRIFANGTELAQGLLGHVVGDEVEVEGQKARIASITAWE